MDHYIDIKLIPNKELRENVLLNKVYTLVHKALGRLTSRVIGISFPDHKFLLGRTLRLHGNEEILNNFQKLNCLNELENNCKISVIKQVPTNAKHRTVSRKQCNMTKAKLNRLIKRGKISTDDVKAYKAKMFSQGLDHAYLELESASNGCKHRRFIEIGDEQETPVAGMFDTFGLSKQATVPWF